MYVETPSSSSSSSSSPSSALPSKHHRNTFLLPPPPRQAEDHTATAAGTTAKKTQLRLTEPSDDAENRDDCDDDNGKAGDGPLALVVLNTKGDSESKDLLRHLWARAALRVCADGGANRLHDSFDGHPPEERARFVPDVIVGDLDSLRPEVAAFYEGLGSEVKLCEDQDYNDFEKCLIEVGARLSVPPPAAAAAAATAAPDVEGGETATVTATVAVTATEPRAEGFATAAVRDHESSSSRAAAATVCAATVVGLGAFGGRFDHEMASISLLHTYTSRFRRFVLMGAGNVAFLLEPGLSHVVEPDVRFEGPTVGLIPVGGACRSVSTKGLKWDLEGGSLEFGVLVSSSNCVVAKEVRVTTDAPLVWTAEFKAAEWMKAVSRDRGL